MSTTTTTKAPAKKATTKAAAPKPAAKKPAETKEPKTYLATATGRGGKTNVRKAPHPVTHAVDVADPDGRTEAARKGLVFRFYTDVESANAFRDKKNAAGYDAITIPATSKEA